MKLKCNLLCLISLFILNPVYSQRGVHPGLNLTGPGGRGSSNWAPPKNKSADTLKEQHPSGDSRKDLIEKKFPCRSKEDTQKECTRPESQ